MIKSACKFSLEELITRASIVPNKYGSAINDAMRAWIPASKEDRDRSRAELEKEYDAPAAPMSQHPELWQQQKQKSNEYNECLWGPLLLPLRRLEHADDGTIVYKVAVRPAQLDLIWSDPDVQRKMWEYVTMGMLPLSFLQSQQLVPAGGSLFRLLWPRITSADVARNQDRPLPSVQKLRCAALAQKSKTKNHVREQDWNTAVLSATNCDLTPIQQKKQVPAFRPIRQARRKRTDKYLPYKKYACSWLFRRLGSKRFHKMKNSMTEPAPERFVHVHMEHVLYAMGFARDRDALDQWKFYGNVKKQWDIDLFFVDEKKTDIDNDKAKAAICAVYNQLRQSLPPNLSILCVRTERAVTLRCPWPFPTVQIVLRPFARLDQLLGSFDLDCTRVALAPSHQEPKGELWCQSSLARVLTRGSGNVASDRYMNPNYERRLLKYVQLGVPASLGVDFDHYHWATPRDKPGLGQFLGLFEQSEKEMGRTLDVPLGQTVRGISEVLPGYSDPCWQTEKFLAEVSSVAIYDRISGTLSDSAIAARNDDIQGLLQSSHLRFRLIKTKQGVRFASMNEIEKCKRGTEKKQLAHAVLETNVPPFTIWTSDCQFLHAPTRHSHPSLKLSWKLSPSVNYSWL